MGNWFEDELFGAAGAAVNHFGWLSAEVSAIAINKAVHVTRNRPHPFSTLTDYTSWDSLTNRTYLARHLPPVPGPVRATPDQTAVQALFTRPPGGQRMSNKSTCLFPAFAQYLTDGFIRTDPTNLGKTTSNHEIDMCPLYGRTPAQTALLRETDTSKGLGRLKSQHINGEEYAPFLYLGDGVTLDPQFNGLDLPLGLAGSPDYPMTPERAKTLFAFGGDRANSTPFAAMMNTLWLREHNRIAGALAHQNPGWDGERVFQTARNIIIPLFIKIVVEQYINHITPLPFKLVCDPTVAWTADWNRPNWMTAEFSLLYRWHSLMPDEITWKGAAPLARAPEWPRSVPWRENAVPLKYFGLNNQPLLAAGLDAAFSAAAAQPTAELGAFNTADALLPIESQAVMQARVNRLPGYNAYRQAFGLAPAARLEDISSNPAVVTVLRGLYGDNPNDIEFYPGLFAEDRVKNAPLPELILTMVAVDAFSQALTNPLLSAHVFNPVTFTQWGFDLIGSTHALEDVLARNVATRGPQPITMTQPGWTWT